MLRNSLDRAINIEIPNGETSATSRVVLPQGVLMAIAVYDDKSATPKHLNMEIKQNASTVIEARHIDAFRRTANNMPKPIMIECDSEYEVRLFCDAAVQGTNHKVQVEFIISKPEMVDHFKLN